MGYKIITDSSCDLPAGLIEELDLEVVPLSVVIDGKAFANDMTGKSLDFKEIYAMLRAGKPITTSAVNEEQARNAIEKQFLSDMHSFSEAINTRNSKRVVELYYPDYFVLLQNRKILS